MNPAQQIFLGMIQNNLQQGLDLLSTEDYDLAKHHFAQAIEQVDQLRDASADEVGRVTPCAPPQGQQPTLDI